MQAHNVGDSLAWLILMISVLVLLVVASLYARDAAKWQAKAEECIRLSKQLTEAADKTSARLSSLCHASK